jgi:hypothetical protein
VGVQAEAAIGVVYEGHVDALALGHLDCRPRDPGLAGLEPVADLVLALLGREQRDRARRVVAHLVGGILRTQ